MPSQRWPARERPEKRGSPEGPEVPFLSARSPLERKWFHAEGPSPRRGRPFPDPAPAPAAPSTPSARAPRAGRRWPGRRASSSARGGSGLGPGTGPRPASGRGRAARTLQEGAALAVRRAPEPGRAVLAARQQALPVRAQAEPVDAPTVLRADPQGRSAAPHPAGRAGGEGRQRPLGKGAPASALPAASSRGHPGGGAPGSCRGGHRARRGKRRTLAPAPPTRLPALTPRARLCVGRPPGTPDGAAAAPRAQGASPLHAPWGDLRPT